MLKWLLTLVIAIFLFGICAPHVARIVHLGRLPGDLAFRFRGRTYVFPFTSTLVLSLLVFLVSRLV